MEMSDKQYDALAVVIDKLSLNTPMFYADEIEFETTYDNGKFYLATTDGIHEAHFAVDSKCNVTYRIVKAELVFEQAWPHAIAPKKELL